MTMKADFRTLELKKIKAEFDFRLVDYKMFLSINVYLICEMEIIHLHQFIVKSDRFLKEISDDFLIQSKQAVIESVYDLIFTDAWQKGGSNKSGDFKYVHDYRQGDRFALRFRCLEDQLVYDLPREIMIRRNRLVQRLIIEILYDKEMPIQELNEIAFIEADVMMSERQILEDLGIIKRFQKAPPNSGSKPDYKVGWYRLTAKGREYYERKYTGFGRTVFIIIWCNSGVQWLSKFLKEEIEKNGYNVYVQEENEPTGEISQDIRYRIENSPFILCDLTGMRPNCIYELGLAHALNKRTIITCRKSDLEEITVKDEKILKIPFDINQYRHSFWNDKDDSEFKEELKERIQQTIEAIQQDFWL